MNLIHVDSDWIAANISDGALFFNEPDTEYRFHTDFEAQGIAVFVTNSRICLDLNGHTITFGLDSSRDGVCGIFPFSRRSHDNVVLGRDANNFSRTAEPNWNKTDTTIKNGRIVHGGTGKWATCIGGQYVSKGLTLDNLYLEVNGEDGMCVNTGTENVVTTLANTHAVNRSTSTSNRHQLPACIKTGNGRLLAYHNILIGGCSGIAAGSNSEVTRNLIRHAGWATNGYGLHLGKENSYADQNLILPSNGRGILFSKSAGHLASRNLLVIHEMPNAEFGTGLGPAAFRLRWAAENTEFTKNRCLAIGGGDNAAANTARLTVNAENHEKNGDHSLPAIPNRIADNEFRAILTATNSDEQYTNAISLEGHGFPENYARTIIENNRFTSNHQLLGLGRREGGCNQQSIRNNSFEWAGGFASYIWLVNALSDPIFRYDYPDMNSYVNSELLQSIKSEVAEEVKSLIEGVSDNVGNRSTFFGGWWTRNSKITLIDSDFGEGVGTDADDVTGATEGEIDIKIEHSAVKDGTVVDVIDYSLVKAAGRDEPVVKWVSGNPEPEPDPPPEVEPPSTEVVSQSIVALETINTASFSRTQERDLSRALWHLEEILK